MHVERAKWSALGELWQGESPFGTGYVVLSAQHCMFPDTVRVLLNEPLLLATIQPVTASVHAECAECSALGGLPPDTCFVVFHAHHACSNLHVTGRNAHAAQ